MMFAEAISVVAAQEPIRLWPGVAPGDTNNMPEEHDSSKPGQGLVAGKPVIRTANVSQPSLTIFRPASEKNTGAMVVVCPGGAYNILAWDLEGTEVAEWLNSIGVTAAVLKYRVPARPGGPRYAAPLQDVQRAMGIVRSRASEWSVDPKRIGVLGFSAGGHLAATISNTYEKRNYETVDAADSVSCRPDFTVLVYPAYLAQTNDLTKLTTDFTVTSNTPPAFIVQTEDDGVKVDCSIVYYRALKAVKVPAEMHLYATGGHGYGLRATSQAVTGWPRLVESWMRARGLLAPH